MLAGLPMREAGGRFRWRCDAGWIGQADGRRPIAGDANLLAQFRGVEFIATLHPSMDSVRGDSVVDRKREVSGNAKDVPDADLMEAKNVLYHSRVHNLVLSLEVQ
jgi:hypothetical protein